MCALSLSQNHLTCLSVLDDDIMLWHKRLGYASLSFLNKLVSKDLVVRLPSIKFNFMTRYVTLVLEVSMLALLSSQKIVLALPDVLNCYMLIYVVPLGSQVEVGRGICWL